MTAGTFAILLLCPLTASAQDVTEPKLKAAYIYNFAKFTQWPADATTAGSPLFLCVVGDPAIGRALDQAVKGLTLSGRTITVPQLAADTPSLGGCHIAYLSGLTATQSAKIITGLRDTSVLTISDAQAFTKAGGIAQFFFENGRLLFDVNLASVKRARLQISSRLLTLARTPK